MSGALIRIPIWTWAVVVGERCGFEIVGANMVVLVSDGEHCVHWIPIYGLVASTQTWEVSTHTYMFGLGGSGY